MKLGANCSGKLSSGFRPFLLSELVLCWHCFHFQSSSSLMWRLFYVCSFYGFISWWTFDFMWIRIVVVLHVFCLVWDLTEKVFTSSYYTISDLEIDNILFKVFDEILICKTFFDSTTWSSFAKFHSGEFWNKSLQLDSGQLINNRYFINESCRTGWEFFYSLIDCEYLETTAQEDCKPILNGNNITLLFIDNDSCQWFPHAM